MGVDEGLKARWTWGRIDQEEQQFLRRDVCERVPKARVMLVNKRSAVGSIARFE